MTTERKYFCNVCKDLVDSLNGVGFSFASKFEHGFPAQHENHLCYKCIAAICDLSVRLRETKELK